MPVAAALGAEFLDQHPDDGRECDSPRRDVSLVQVVRDRVAVGCLVDHCRRHMNVRVIRTAEPHARLVMEDQELRPGPTEDAVFVERRLDPPPNDDTMLPGEGRLNGVRLIRDDNVAMQHGETESRWTTMLSAEEDG